MPEEPISLKRKLISMALLGCLERSMVGFETVAWNENARGVSAIKLRDPDGHEFLIEIQELV
jgi:hypothetical protein